MISKIEETNNAPETNPEISEESLKLIAATQGQISDVKKNLGTIVDTMAANPSMISRASASWGEVPLYVKIVGGVILVAVPFTATVVTGGLALPAVVSGATALTYTGGAIILDDHDQCNKSNLAKLKDGIMSLAQVLELTIGALDKIKEQLSHEIRRFKDQNDKLELRVTMLVGQVDSLTNQVELLMQTERLLKSQKDTLEQSVQNLQQNVSTQDESFKKMQAELEKITKDYDSSQAQLSKKVIELTEVRQKMDQEVAKAKRITDTLKGTVQTLSGTVIQDKKKKQEFQDRLDNFLSNTEVSYSQVAARVCQAEEDLIVVKVQLEESNNRYKALLDKQEELVNRMTMLGEQATKENIAPKYRVSALLSTQGKFATQPQPPLAIKDQLSSRSILVS